MIILTGGAGFIGSVFLKLLNQNGITDILLIDNLGKGDKWKNISQKHFDHYIHKDLFYTRMEKGEFPDNVSHVIHLGACSSTTELDMDYLMHNNYEYSKLLASYCLDRKIPFIYASSAATYGDGGHGFEDDENSIEKLKPLNGYGYSKHVFDSWILRQKKSSQVVGLKFFNVFGPNEYHKGSMRSLIEKAYLQVKEQNKINLFKSEHPDYKDGEQKRDFVYVKDVAEVMLWFMNTPSVSGIFNIGSGVANTWLTLAEAIFSSLQMNPNIEFIELPDSLKEKYQYFTLAPIQKLRLAGYTKEFTDLTLAVTDYIQNYLRKEDKYL